MNETEIIIKNTEKEQPKYNSLWPIQRERDHRGTPQYGRRGTLIEDALPKRKPLDVLLNEAAAHEEKFQEELTDFILSRTISNANR